MCRPCVLRDTSLDFHVKCECVRVTNLTNDRNFPRSENNNNKIAFVLVIENMWWV